MALTFGSGEQVDRLRRGLDIKGRVVLGIDEIVVPIVNVGDLTGPPIRKTGIRWWAAANVPAVAAEIGRFRIFHQNKVDQLVTDVWLNAAAALTFQIGAGFAGAAGGTAANTTELVALPLVGGTGGGDITRGVGIFHLEDSSAAPTISTVMLRIQSQAAVTSHFPIEIVLPAVRDPETANFSTLTVESLTNNFAFNITMSGLYFDTLPLNVST